MTAIIVPGYAAWGQSSMKPIKLNQHIHYLNIENIIFSSEANSNGNSLEHKWNGFKPKKFNPFQPSSVNYYDPLGLNPSDQPASAAVQLSLTDCYQWLRTKYHKHKHQFVKNKAL